MTFVLDREQSSRDPIVFRVYYDQNGDPYSTEPSLFNY